MAECPVMIRDDQIAFSTRLFRPNDLFYDVTPEQFFTRCGYVIPFNADSAQVIDYIENGENELALFETGSRAIIVNHKAEIHEILLAQEKDPKTNTHRGSMNVMRRRILSGSGVRFARSPTGDFEEKAILAVNNTPDIFAAVRAFVLSGAQQNCRYIVLKIDDIVSRLHERGLCDPFDPPKSEKRNGST